jgi:hypothetical protein
MARFEGKKGNVKIDTVGGGAAEQVLGVNKWSLNSECDTPITTGFDSSGHETHVIGIDRFTGSLGGHWDASETDILGGEAAAPPILSAGQAIDAELYLQDSDTDSWYAGTMTVQKFSAEVNVDGSVDWTADVKGVGTLTQPLAPA